MTRPGFALFNGDGATRKGARHAVIIMHVRNIPSTSFINGRRGVDQTRMDWHRDTGLNPPLPVEQIWPSRNQSAAAHLNQFTEEA